MKSAQCKRGHRWAEHGIKNHRGYRICQLCREQAQERYRLRSRNKYRVIEPDMEVRTSNEVPIRDTIIAHGYWDRVVRRAMLLPVGDAVVVPIADMFLTGSAHNAIIRAGKRHGARLEVRIGEQWIYVIQRGAAARRAAA